MKTQISSLNPAREARYSGVYQQQGRMLSDADWNALTDITRRQLEHSLASLIGTGSPASDGILRRDESSTTVTYGLKWGRVFVDGVPARLLPAKSSTTSEKFDYTNQAHFAQPPALPAGADYCLYLDVWDRSVTALEDPELLDAGLHGADTTTRSETLAQVKWAPIEFRPEDPAANPPRGNARLTARLRAGLTEADPCDPCADEIELQDRVGNYLFRLEVHDVSRAADGRAQRITLKWSSENGAEISFPDDTPPGFRDADQVYEFFSGADESSASEKSAGYFHPKNLGSWSPVRGALTAGYPETPPAGFSLVRRWDGYCELERAGSGWGFVTDGGGIVGVDHGVALDEGSSAQAHGHVSAGTGITINLNSLVLELDIDEQPVLAGDFWLAEVREAVHEAGSLLLGDAGPAGIEHHYMLLGQVIGGNFQPALDRDCRRFDFPPLTDIGAADVCYPVPDCGDSGNATVRGLLDDKFDGWLTPEDGSGASVARMLDALLCRHRADTLPLAKSESLCPELRSADVVSVQDALDFLCRQDIQGCATHTVLPEKGWEKVFEKIPRGGDAHICLREGLFELGATVDIRGKGHITIDGAGPGTQIICPRREAALTFSDCASVSVSQLAIEAGAVGSTRPHKHLNGALTFSNCADVSVSSCTLRCAADARPAATCLTIAHDKGRKGDARVSDCRLEIGHRQTGMLLLNMKRATVRDNQLVVRSRPASLSFDRRLKDLKIAGRARKLLINRALVRNFDQPGATRGLKQVKLDSRGSRQLAFESPVAGSVWKEMISAEIGKRPVASNQALLKQARELAGRVFLEAPLRQRFPAFQRFYERLRLQDPAVAFKGIVCAGIVARDIRIVDNSISGTQEGIHVGVSDREDEAERRYAAGRVMIQGNNIRLRLPPLVVQRRGGVFVGNCRHLSVIDNHIDVQRWPLSHDTAIEGLRVYGHLGGMLAVRDNQISGCSTGIRVTALNSREDKTPRQWFVKDNLLDGASRALRLSADVRHSDNVS